MLPMFGYGDPKSLIFATFCCCKRSRASSQKSNKYAYIIYLYFLFVICFDLFIYWTVRVTRMPIAASSWVRYLNTKGMATNLIPFLLLQYKHTTSLFVAVVLVSVGNNPPHNVHTKPYYLFIFSL
jgi:hypothetical protein